MLPFARYVFTWKAAGGKYFNVYDPDNSVYKDGSSISEKTAKALGLPVVQTAEDEEAMMQRINAAYVSIRMGL